MNKAALRDLEKIETFYHRKTKEIREVAENAMPMHKAVLLSAAERQESMAETVRVCIVTIQAAEQREPD